MKTPIEQAKTHLLNVLQQASLEVKEIIYPCSPQDVADYKRALLLADVQIAFNRRGIKATIQTVDAEEVSPQILIATIDDVATGKLDRYFKPEQYT